MALEGQEAQVLQEAMVGTLQVVQGSTEITKVALEVRRVQQVQEGLAVITRVRREHLEWVAMGALVAP